MIKKDRLVKLTQKVLSFNSENPPGNELKLAKFIAADMRSLGLEVKLYTFAKNRPNIIATLKGRLPRAWGAFESILITPHFDTVPIGNGWKYDTLRAGMAVCVEGFPAKDGKHVFGGASSLIVKATGQVLKIQGKILWIPPEYLGKSSCSHRDSR